MPPLPQETPTPTLRQLAETTVRAHMRWPKWSHPDHNQRCVDLEAALYEAIEAQEAREQRYKKALKVIVSINAIGMESAADEVEGMVAAATAALFPKAEEKDGPL